MKPRITAADAVAIYKLKHVKRRASGNLSTHLAVQYNITEKAVLDIWRTPSIEYVHACFTLQETGLTSMTMDFFADGSCPVTASPGLI